MRGRERLKLGLGIFLILAVSFLVRVEHFSTLYPYFFYQDELRQIEVSLKLLREKPLEPDFYLYPHLTIYLTSLAFAGYSFLKTLPQIVEQRSFAPWFERIKSLTPTSRELLFLTRAMALIFGLAGVLGVWLLARRLLPEAFAFFASLIYALLPLSVSFSHLAKVDIFMECFVIYGLYFQLRLIEQGRMRDYLASALFASLSMDSKINFFPYISLVFASLIRASKEEQSLSQWLKDKRVWLAGAGSLIFAFLFSPYYYLNFSKALKMIGWIYFVSGFNSFYHIDPHHFWLDRYYYACLVLFPFLATPVLYLFFLFGLGERLIKNDYQEWFLLLINFFSFAYFFSSQAEGSYPIYLYMYIVPFFALFSARALELIWSRGWKKLSGAIAGVLIILGLFQSQNYYALNFQAFDRMGEVLSRLPQGSKVLGYSVYLPGPGLGGLNYLRAWPQNLNPEPVKEFAPDYILVNRSDFAGFEKFYQDLPIDDYLDSLLKGEWGFELLVEHKVIYPGDWFYQTLDPEFIIELLLLKRKDS